MNAVEAQTADDLAEEGVRLLLGQGRAQDSGEAAQVLAKAAEAGSARAAALAAVLAGAGVGRPQNWEDAFGYLEQAATLGDEEARRQLLLLAGEPTGDWRHARTRIDPADWLKPAPVALMSHTPKIAVFRDLIPLAACEWLIELGQRNPTPALIYDPSTGVARADSLRSNSMTFLAIHQRDLVVLLVQARLAASAAQPRWALEAPSLLSYEVGQEFGLHFDFLDATVPAMRSEMEAIGQRVATFLVYLNNDYDGGETYFPDANIRFKGRPGDGLLFYNIGPDGAPDPRSRHAGLPPTRGRKWLLSQWIRNKPQRIA